MRMMIREATRDATRLDATRRDAKDVQGDTCVCTDRARARTSRGRTDGRTTARPRSRRRGANNQ